MPAGRPCSYTDKIADEICSRLIEGESLRSICLDEHMPSAGTVCKWLAREDRAEFRQQYARAREMQADIIADEVLHIANNTEIGVIVTEKTTGIETRHADMIEHRRLKIDARKWYAGKIAPKKYGDKVSTELSGPDGGPVQVARIERVIVRPTEA